MRGALFWFLGGFEDVLFVSWMLLMVYLDSFSSIRRRDSRSPNLCGRYCFANECVLSALTILVAAHSRRKIISAKGNCSLFFENIVLKPDIFFNTSSCADAISFI